MAPSIHDILTEKRQGRAHSAESLAVLVSGVVSGEVTRAQAAAWLAFAYVQGLSSEETALLTRLMTETGEVLSWDGIEGPFIDKHSTGGVGDKVSLILAPLWAELGVRVPMISGRGLGHTGGTLDKLESIPGYRCDLSKTELRDVLQDVGCFISGQTGEVAPADRIFYALRNETCTVPSIPLITGSILSKKLAEGIVALNLDVKVGTGAFMKTLPEALALAESLVEVGNLAGVQTRAWITDMNQPLGWAVGNAFEVEESVDCLRGEGPDDLRELVLALADHPDAEEVLSSGAAFERFVRMVEAQGGDARVLDTPNAMRGSGARAETVLAERSGWVACCDALTVGEVAFRLGAGRLQASDPVHPGVGVFVHKKQGERVERGEPLATLWAVNGAGDAAREGILAAYEISEQAVAVPDLIVTRVEGEPS